MKAKVTKAQRAALEHYANGDGAGESWASELATAHVNLAWHRHERTISSLERHGWVDANGEITDAGRAALAKKPEGT